jgi:hypothetical protein
MTEQLNRKQFSHVLTTAFLIMIVMIMALIVGVQYFAG